MVGVGRHSQTTRGRSLSPGRSSAKRNGKERSLRTRAHVAVVVVYRHGDQLVIWPHERKRVLLHRFPVTIYEIDLALHSTVISSELPSGDTAASFNASFHIQWRVFNPSAVVRHRVLNIR